MSPKMRGYEGLLEHPEVLVSLCGAVMLQAVKDRVALEKKGNLRSSGSCANIKALDRWFEGKFCAEMCRVLGISPDFSLMDWSKVRVGRIYRTWNYGA